jgi:hypothetical protein
MKDDELGFERVHLEWREENGIKFIVLTLIPYKPVMLDYELHVNLPIKMEGLKLVRGC